MAMNVTVHDEIAAMRQRAVELHSEAWRRRDGGLDLTLEAMRIEAEADALEEAILARAAQETPDAR